MKIFYKDKLIFNFLILIFLMNLLLLGLYFLKPYFNSKKDVINNKNLLVFSPKPGEKIKSPLKVVGKARGNWFFEATFPIFLTDWDGKIITQGYAQAKGDWMTTAFVEFEGILEFENPVFPNVPQNHFSRRGYLIFKKSNPSGLLQYNESVEIPIIFE